MQGVQVWSLVRELRSHTCAKPLQSYLTLFNPINCSPPCSSLYGILQARILEWVAMPFSRGSFWCRGQILISCSSCTAGRFFTIEPPHAMRQEKKKKKKEREKVQGDCFLGNCYRLSLLTLPAFEKVYNLINFHERNIWEQHPDQNTRVFLALTSLHVLPLSSGPRASHSRDLSIFVQKWIHTVCTLCE